MSEVNDNILRPVSINLLYDGMVVQDDIYDADGNRLLIKSGNTITDVHIQSITSLNSGRGTIYVTGRTHKTMLSKKTDIEASNREVLEKTTGYADVKDETFALLEEISKNKTVCQNSLMSVSNELSTRLETTSPTIIMSLINAMAPIDEYLQRHSVNVGMLNGLIGQWMGLTKEGIDRLVLIGLLHDCGKTQVPPQVLNAPRRLTGVEFEVIKMHAAFTYDLLSEFPDAIRYSASSHHERLNGTGYPRGLADVQVTWEARISSVSDIYDAMVSQRSYKRPRSPFGILALLGSLCGTDLDPEVVRIFVEQMPKELMNKPVEMSDGTIGVLREYDTRDIEYPMVELSGHVIKTNKELYCVSMYDE